MGRDHFDFVIVGGGSAGCALAARLSEDARARVLLLEAGGRDWNPLISIPLGVGLLWSDRLYDWGMDSEPEPNLDNRRIEMARGRVLGGSSSINAMAHVRGHPRDYDRWADSGCPGWSHAELLPYFRRSESWQGGADAWRGGQGPIKVGYTTASDPLFAAWLQAAADAGIPEIRDYNAADSIGIARSQYVLDRGRRCSAARGYLAPVRGRPNLVVRTGALATRLLIEGRRAQGVEYRWRGRGRRALAGTEVILTAGVFQSPRLLMQSGIGPADHLRQHGIAVLHDRPGIGGNLQDHLAVVVAYARRTPGAFRAEMRADRIALSMARAWLFGTGPATVLPSGLHAFLRTQAASAVPDIQMMFRGVPRDAGVWFPLIRPAYADGYSIRPVLLHPRSRGTVRLGGPRPDDPLRIRPDFLSEPQDLVVLRTGLRLARELGGSGAMAAFRAAELRPGPGAESDAALDAFIRRTALTAHHPCGTCRMGSDADAVVAPDLRAHGLEGLRIADASVMPDLVSGNINAAVLAIAEKCADLVRGAHGLAGATC